MGVAYLLAGGGGKGPESPVGPGAKFLHKQLHGLPGDGISGGLGGAAGFASVHTSWDGC